MLCINLLKRTELTLCFWLMLQMLLIHSTAEFFFTTFVICLAMASETATAYHLGYSSHEKGDLISRGYNPGRFSSYVCLRSGNCSSSPSDQYTVLPMLDDCGVKRAAYAKRSRRCRKATQSQTYFSLWVATNHV